MRDRKRTHLVALDVHQGGERHGAAGERRFDIDEIERGQIALLLRQDLEQDPIGFELREILRDLTLAERVVEGIVDQLRRYAEAGSLIAVDGDLELRRIRR